MKTKGTNFVGLIVLLFSSGTWAADIKEIKASSMSVLPFTGPNLNDVVLDSQLTANGSASSVTTLDMYVSCFGTNLRAVPNPISENSTIYAKMTYLTSTGTKTFEIPFPAKATMKSFKTEDSDQELTNNTRVEGNSTQRLRAQLRGNLIRIELAEAKSIAVDVLATGTDFSKLSDLNTKAEFLSNISFRQTVPDSQDPVDFMAFTGPITGANNWYVSENGKTLTMLVSFPGENGYCGGFFSPLILKFDGDDMPTVDKSSRFPLFGRAKHKISWPSFAGEVYFLALDRNRNGKIDGGRELFGDINKFPDGFKNLAIYDLNKDGVIDEKDPIFNKLLLWRDKNHDGISSASEIKTLKDMGVISIPLTYDGTLQSLNANAKVIGPGEFTYKKKNGEVNKGRVWDIFLKFIP